MVNQIVHSFDAIEFNKQNATKLAMQHKHTVDYINPYVIVFYVTIFIL